VLDALHRAELRTLAARKAEIHIHESDFAGTLFFAADFVGSVGKAIFLKTPLDNVDTGHTTIVRDYSRMLKNEGSSKNRSELRPPGGAKPGRCAGQSNKRAADRQ